MKLDNKYFYPFIAICGVLTLIAIVYGSIRYSDRQEVEFRENVRTLETEHLTFPKMNLEDSVRVSSFRGDPILIHFWATWSGKSLRLQEWFHELHPDYPELTVISAAIRDDQQMIQAYIDEHDYPWQWVVGTELYQSLRVPGVPSVILLDRNGELVNIVIGDDQEQIYQLIRTAYDEEQ